MALTVLKDELDTWDAALEAYDSGNISRALNVFERISDTSKVAMNIGLIHMYQGNFGIAIDNFTNATKLDRYLAVGYFQRGVCYYRLQDMEKALNDFCDAEIMMRGNDVINYRELGLQFELHVGKVFLNRGLTLMKLGRRAEGIAYLSKTGPREQNPEIFTMSKGSLFRPLETKRLLLQKFQQANDTGYMSYTSTRATSSPDVKSDSSSTYAPTDSDHVSLASRHRRDLSFDEKKRDKLNTSGHVLESSSSSSSSTPLHLRTDLIAVMGPDPVIPTMEISTIPCAGVRIASGKLLGLMGWRLIVELVDDGSDHEPNADGYHRQKRLSLSWKQKQKGKVKSHAGTPAIVSNFILDTGSSKSVISQEALRALGYRGKYHPGEEVKKLRIQGIRVQCVVARLGEASRLGGQFLTAGNLTFYFDTKLNAPVLYVGDETNDRPALDTISRTVTTVVNPDTRRSRRASLWASVSSVMAVLNLYKSEA